MDSSLRERFARLGPIRGIGRVSSGSPAAFVLRLPPGQPMPGTIDATLALARRGLEMLPAKRAIEALVRDGRVRVDLPMVEDTAVLADELAAASIAAAVVGRWWRWTGGVPGRDWPDPTTDPRGRLCRMIARQIHAAGKSRDRGTAVPSHVS